MIAIAKELFTQMEGPIFILFFIVMAFGMYMIVYYNVLRFRGLVSGYKITRSSFDDGISRTRDERNLKRLRYGRKIYLMFLYSFFVAFGLLMLVVWADPVK